MKRLVLGLSASALFAVPAFAQFPYTIDFHFGPPSYSGCNEASVADAVLECDNLDTSFNPFGGQPNFAWLLVGGVPPGSGAGAPGGIGGAQFGIQYSAGTSLSWTLCTGGSEIPQNDAAGTWPASGTGNAVTFAGGCKLVTANEDGLTRLGWFTVFEGAAGRTIQVMEDPRIGQAQAADCATTQFRICRQSMGQGDLTTGGTGGRKVCGFLCAVPVNETSWSSIKSTYAN
jgi:hypothetical protein